ncbi:MAG: hypothetical protein A3A96_00755 [Candidatus Zambryskibacteria bacterium RIFCSPLOWO2_01_FULL_39_39]|uniref:Bacterial spore germination immunoglobulin-like domain-containing protein n=1 Tax=Candidatus Zambryskibacteria bacterium RIFCSPLOWO2_01_FULL_39_39 TaxID=1802758 RepID=A0A1G2TXC5_9BACT|nr:MAG: hypothetical protein A2644_01140 [Candidatus Zambryskibacteria bacterium RIFCSPHIGHO2_01_FULL_39_63]OHA95013.1 MAG: hypothetical protein A3B88_01375 [Candidatus Zambryskibacteria bacterium RIFCSPHIGHO2_02_FULL_39_19]OHA99194.1 MAG: hypothetical protein A3F20_03325 [Candidatus Zambryskibacteria bacterium RIFCSPHIGHO2_12_FULL_39_21]OHB01956.1 MAG: hypothetical protein A3A96_00755 [Candidatus Zambryskibacteria bacterium RIFCSPLOWO2_01_FULL_39_39]
MKKGFTLYIVIILVVIGTLIWLAFSRSEKSEAPITSLITYTNSSDNLIKVELPFPGAVVGKEFSVIGEARGTWFFEASFPIEVVDKNGKVIATAIAQAQPDPETNEINWMTENFVPFKADIKVPQNYIGEATLVLKKDNPSGLPEHDASISFQINVEY